MHTKHQKKAFLHSLNVDIRSVLNINGMRIRIFCKFYSNLHKCGSILIHLCKHNGEPKYDVHHEAWCSETLQVFSWSVDCWQALLLGILIRLVISHLAIDAFLWRTKAVLAVRALSLVLTPQCQSSLWIKPYCKHLFWIWLYRRSIISF